MIDIELCNAWGAAWASFMMRALVDASVLLALVMIVWLPLRRRMSAQLAYGLFCLVLFKLIAPVPAFWPSGLPSLSFRQAAEHAAHWVRPDEPPSLPQLIPESNAPVYTPLLLPTTGDLGATASDIPFAWDLSEPLRAPRSGAVSPTDRLDRQAKTLTYAAWLMLGWASVSIVLLIRFCKGLVSTRRLIREAVPLMPEWLPIDVDTLRRAAGVRSAVRWAVSPRLSSPAVGGLVRPTVVIPPDLDDGLTPKQLTWVLLHELAHVRRCDLWMVVAQRVAQAVFFFHPAVHVANWIIDQLREYACDDAALAACKSSRHDCGEGFLTIVGRSVERTASVSPALGLFESQTLIRRRLLRILDKRRKVHERLSPGAAIGLLALALLVLPLGSRRDVVAHSNKDAILSSGSKLISTGEPNEPSTYRPGAVWHRLESPGVPSSSGRHSAVLAVAYSPDGSLLATAGDDKVVMVRKTSSGDVVHRLEGHGDTVSCLAFSPDGRTLATGSFDNTLKLWDVAAGRLKATLQGHKNWVFSVAFSPDGLLLASAGHDQAVRLWNVRRAEPLGMLPGHRASVRSVAFSPDGTLIATAGGDRVVRLWGVQDRKLRNELRGHKGTIRALAFAPDRATLASAGEDGEAILWTLNTGRIRAKLTGHVDMVVCLAFSPTGRTLATGGLDATVKLWDTQTGRERANLQGHKEGVPSLAFAPGGRQLATGSFDGSVRLWEPAAPVFSPAACLAYPDVPSSVVFAADGRTVLAAGQGGVVRWDALTGSELPTTDSQGTVIAAAPNGSTFATGGTDGRVRLFDAASGKQLADLAGHQGAVRAIAYAHDARLLVSGGQDGVVQLWDGERLCLLQATVAQPHPVICVAFAPGGRAIAFSTSDEPSKAAGVVLWDFNTLSERVILSGLEAGIVSFAFAPDGTVLATADTGGSIKLWDTATFAPRITMSSQDCHSLAFSPDGHTLASAHQGGDVVLWDVREGCQLGLLKGHHGTVVQAAFAPDGRSLATAGKDNTVKLWNLAARRQTARATLKGDLSALWSVAYSPDSQTLAIADGPADEPGTITLWNVATRRLKATLEGHKRGVATAVYSPDGSLLASGGWDGTIRLWDVVTGGQRYELSGLNGVTELSFSPDGKRLASAGEGTFVTLWDVSSGTEAARLSDFRYRVQCVAFSPDGKYLAAGGGVFEDNTKARGEVKLWDVEREAVIASLEGHTRAVIAIAFSPDSTTLATGGVDQTVRLWDLPSGKARLVLGGLPNCVQALAFSPCGRTLAWGGRSDGLVALHDVATGAECVRLVGHSAAVRGIAFAPDGIGLATASADRSIKLWDVPLTGTSLNSKP